MIVWFFIALMQVAVLGPASEHMVDLGVALEEGDNLFELLAPRKYVGCVCCACGLDGGGVSPTALCLQTYLQH